MAEYLVRDGTEADVPGAVALARLALGEGPLTDEAYFRWKHLASPFGPSPMRLAVAEDGTLVGLRMFMRWRWETAGQAVEAVRAVDTATHPDWRRRGIFRVLTLGLVDAAERDGVAFVFNTPNDQSHPGYLTMGWHDVARVPVRVRPLRPARMAARLARRAAGLPAPPPTAAEDDGSVAALLAEPGLDAVLARAGAHAAGDRRLRTPRSAEYLRWRYRDVPGVTYRARWSFRGDDGGLVIARHRSRGGLEETTVVDVVATPSPAGRRLAAQALRETCADSDGDYAAASGAPATVESAVLGRVGFVPVPAPIGPRFVVRPLGATVAPDPTAWASWACQVGDLELF